MNPNEIKEIQPVRRNTIAEMRQIIDAIEQGKEVEYQYVNSNFPDLWDKYEPTEPNFFAFRYRIKPEEPEKRWRPFKDVQEFIDAAGGLGAIWLKHRIGWAGQVTYICHNDTKNPISIGPAGLDFATLCKFYTFADGRPCGVEE